LRIVHKFTSVTGGELMPAYNKDGLLYRDVNRETAGIGRTDVEDTAGASFPLQRIGDRPTIAQKPAQWRFVMRVADLISSRKEIYSVSDDATVHDVARYLRDREIRSVGVLDAKGKLVGIVSQADISDRVAAENKCPAWMRVTEIMTKELVTIAPEMGLEDCLLLMEKHHIYHLLVMGEKEKFLGLISVSDLLRVISSDQKARADMLEAFVFPQR
jgi:CBS domain-containing protein